MVVAMCLGVDLVGHVCVAGLVEVLDEVPGAVEKELGSSAVCVESEAAPYSPEENCPGHAGVKCDERQVVRSRTCFVYKPLIS